jgi:hypothetical protein
MSFDFEIRVSASKLRFAPVDGRRTFFASIKFGPFAAWVERWDTNRSKRPLVKSRDGLMAWTAGVRSSIKLRSPIVRNVNA